MNYEMVGTDVIGFIPGLSFPLRTTIPHTTCRDHGKESKTKEGLDRSQSLYTWIFENLAVSIEHVEDVL